MRHQNTLSSNILNLTVIVAALGYFVDIYDLVLFGIVKTPSLMAIGIPQNQILDKGFLLLNWQMTGMLIGGILWGIFGDKKGRLSVLFGSIFLYSAANIANGFAHDINTYAVCRFFAGLGLSGELGAGITLVSETLTKEKRGYGTTIVAAMGISGAVVSSIVAKLTSWQITYFVGGGLGLMLFVLRLSVYESGMYKQSRDKNVQHGNFISLFTDRKKFLRYIRCILIGLPVWFVIGILIFDSADFAKVLGVKRDVNNGSSIMYHYAGASIGAFLSGYLSQWLKSRKKSLYIFLISLMLFIGVLPLMRGITSSEFYWFLFFFGIANGYWAVFIVTAAEQFGTNIRATVTTTVPNFVRGSVPLITTLFVLMTKHFGLMNSALILGFTTMAIALAASFFTKETYHHDLDFVEP
jgi:MFS transporter, putative metabolite:H+ symporter